MCGIAGIYTKSLSASVKRAKLSSMISAMRHRGPNGTQIYVSETMGLAANRLAIVDPQSKHRLSWDDKNRFLVAFNGEIYNHDALRRSQSEGAQWRTRTDTEVVARLTSSKAEDALPHLSGDFALAFWDSTIQRGFIARDRLGVKPLYYGLIDGGLVFASEIRSILAVFPELADLSSSAIRDYLSYRFVPTPNTVYHKIKKLPAGCSLTLSDRNPAPKAYWDIPLRVVISKQSNDLVEEARCLLEKSIRRRLTEEVICGTLLSGGLDSSLVTAIASQGGARPLRTYSIVYLDDPKSLKQSEHEASRLVAGLYRTDHRELSVGPTEFRDAADSTLDHLEDLIADPPSVLRGILCKAASRDGVKVLLSGEGADELFAGYAIYSQLLLSNDSYSGMGRLMTESDKRTLLATDFASIGSETIQMKQTTPRATNRLQEMLYTDCKHWLADDLLITADKTSMMSSVEVRVPFLDDDVVSFAFSLDPTIKLSSPLSKAFLRRVAAPYLPNMILERDKRGFPLPLGFWLRGPLRDWTNQLVTEDLIHRGYFRKRELRRFMSDYFQRESNRLLDHIVWSLIVLELFLKRHVARGVSKSFSVS